MPSDSPRLSNQAAKRRAVTLAASQHGVIHLDQALEVGLTRDLVYRLSKTGEWTRVLTKVFAVPGYPSDWRQGLMAACLWGGRTAAASHRSAGRLWGLDGIKWSGAEITVTGTTRLRQAGVVVHRTEVPFGVQRVDGIPVTSATRTLVDLASVLPESGLEIALEDALRRRLTSMSKLKSGIQDSNGLRGIRALRSLVAARCMDGRPTDSTFEVRLLQILRRAGLPRPRLQYLVEASGGYSARLDFAYPEIKVGIEADSYRFHSGRAAWSRDRTRLNQLTADGWQIFHVTYEDLRRGAPELVEALRALLGRRRLFND